LNPFLEKLKDSLFSILPIAVIVLILNFTVLHLEAALLIRFLIGVTSIVLGLSIFLLGIDISISKIGSLMSAALAKSNKAVILLIGGFLLGFFISIAEPALMILAEQVDSVSAGAISRMSILAVVSVGLGIMIALGLYRIVKNTSLKIVLAVLYFVILILALFVTPEFLAIAFDASGATTGAMAVPFVLALAAGVSRMKKNSNEKESDSFGLVGIASSGAIMAVMIMCIVTNVGTISGELVPTSTEGKNALSVFFEYVSLSVEEVFLSLAPIVIMFFVFQKLSFKMKHRPFFRIIKGLVYTYVGLVLFLAGVNAGFMEIGSEVGAALAAFDNKFFLIAIGFILGFVSILAEPSVYVLTRQVEEETSGSIQKKVLVPTLSIGVGVAVAISVIRIIVPGIQLWHYLLPGYIIAVGLMYFVSNTFVGIAYDSGGVASGPMTATFILAFIQGAASIIPGADVMVDGFGMIAMVAMTPIIAIQILGLIYRIKSAKAAKRGAGINE